MSKKTGREPALCLIIAPVSWADKAQNVLSTWGTGPLQDHPEISVRSRYKRPEDESHTGSIQSARGTQQRCGST